MQTSKSMSMRWWALGIALILVGLGIGAWGCEDTYSRFWSQNGGLRVLRLTSNTTHVVALPQGVTYAILVSAVAPVDHCEVRSPTGAGLVLEQIRSQTDNAGNQEINRFTTTVAGNYQVICTAKSEGRTVQLIPRCGTGEFLGNPLVWTGIGLVLVGLLATVIDGRMALIRSSRGENGPKRGRPDAQIGGDQLN